MVHLEEVDGHVDECLTHLIRFHFAYKVELVCKRVAIDGTMHRLSSDSLYRMKKLQSAIETLMELLEPAHEAERGGPRRPPARRDSHQCDQLPPVVAEEVDGQVDECLTHLIGFHLSLIHI